jgi:glycosyltransferase involved in cell wall biosynthesis
MASTVASVVLLTYNQEAFVQEAFESILNQDTDNIEIVISDDCSSDSTWYIILAVAQSYVGPKKLILSRNVSNLGIVENYAAAVKQSTGKLIFMAAGDDISMPNRCSKCIQFWIENQKKHDLVAADALDMSLTGEVLGRKDTSNLEDWTTEKWFKKRPFFFGASHMVTRKLLEIGPFNNNLPYEDQCLFFRAILMGGAVRLPIPLVKHRRGGISQKLGFQIGHRRAEISRSMDFQILELEQFLRDAISLNRRHIIDDLIKQRMAYCHAVSALFKSPNPIKSLIVFLGSSEVPVRDRYRYTRYFLFYPFLAVAHVFRDGIRVLRGKT